MYARDKLHSGKRVQVPVSEQLADDEYDNGANGSSTATHSPGAEEAAGLIAQSISEEKGHRKEIRSNWRL